MSNIYSIIDTETTGFSPKFNRVIDIGVVSIKDGKVINKYQTLVNPNQYIPNSIKYFTGIDNNMVAKAPEFYDISYEFKDLIENTVIVAHNASFDVSFIKSEFKRVDLNINIKSLCTLNLCRKLYSKDLNRFNLDAVCNFFNVRISERHRAMGDAEATAKVFIKMWKENYGMWEEIENAFAKAYSE